MTKEFLVDSKILRCPECKCEEGLQVQPDRLSCRVCNYSASVVEGVLLTLGTSRVSSARGLVTRTFDAAQVYSKMIRFKWWVMTRLGVRDEFLGISDAVKDKIVLDVGCGPELDLPSNEHDFRTAQHYVGVDYSGDFLKQAANKFRFDNVDFVQAEAQQLPFNDKSFDTVIAAFTIHHIDIDPILVVDELFRVARKNVIIFDHIKRDAGALRTLQTLYWRFVDGGYRYQTKQEWTQSLRGRNPEATLRTGAIGRHVLKMHFLIGEE